MAPIIPARLRAFRAEDDAVSPNRRRTSDGWYANKPGDHNVDSRGVVHADDTGQSMPGTPYWLDSYGKLDVFAAARAVVVNYRSLTPPQRQARWRWLYDGGYMVWYEAALGYEVIFDPATHPSDDGTRPNGHPKIGHTEHLHRSIGHTIAAENDTMPFFTEPEDDEMTPEQMAALRAQIKSDTVAVVRKVLDEGLPALRAQIKSDTVAVVRKVLAEELAKP